MNIISSRWVMPNILVHGNPVPMGSQSVLFMPTHGNSERGLISRVGGVNNRYAVVS